MVNNQTIDIIIPNYNKAKYLRQCLNSIIDQTYKNWKVYLIDDNSNDNSKEILSKYQNIENIKIFNLKENKGPAYCRNFGIQKSNSEFIAFMDSDDYWPKDKLEKQISNMLNINSNFTYTDFCFFFNDDLNKKKMTNLPSKYNYDSFLKHSSMSTSSIIIRREILNDILFQKVNHEDYLFKCDLLKKGEVACKIKETFVFYRINKNNRSSDKIKNIISLWRINKEKNNLNFLKNLKSIFFISLNSLKKYGWK
tara:strand:- start:44 stop:799 length:756 start_codon:yes stop_codon:yes gene_type:complete